MLTMQYKTDASTIGLREKARKSLEKMKKPARMRHYGAIV